MAALCLVAPMPGNKTEPLIQRGHFLGKEGGHIDGKLSKQLIFDDIELFELLVRRFGPIVAALKPSVLVAEQSSAVKIAERLGRRLHLGVVAVEKDATTILLDDHDTSAPLIIEDNLVSGASVARVSALMSDAGTLPTAVATLFDSNGSSRSTIDVPTVAAHHLDITSWPAERCELCRELGAHTLGLTTEGITAL